MARKIIPIDVERKLCAESMGRCMNPACQAELFRKKGDVIEKSHIIPYCKTADKRLVGDFGNIRNYFYLHPYFDNLLKRRVKTPKLYFYDIGLVCCLTKWSSREILESGAMNGTILGKLCCG